MKASKIFISAPISIDWSTVQCFESEIKKRGFGVSYWERWSKYSNTDLDSSAAVVFILPKNQFECGHSELPIGLKTELSRAYAQGKKIYLGYVTSTGSYNIYDVNTNGKYIKGISGTANDIYGDLKSQDNASQFLEDRMAKKIAQNSQYGAWVGNPCGEIELPKGPTGSVGSPGVAGVAGIEYDERLLLMA